MPAQRPKREAVGPSQTRPRLVFSARAGQALTRPSQSSMPLAWTPMTEVEPLAMAIRPAPTDWSSQG